MASLNTIEGKAVQAELLEARTGIQVKDMQGIRAWRNDDTGNFGVEILHPHKTGRFGREQMQWHRLSMKPRSGDPQLSYAKIQQMAAVMDPFLRDKDFEAAPEPKPKKQRKPKKAAAAQPEKGPNDDILPSFMRKGAKTMDERVAEHQAAQAKKSRFKWPEFLKPKNWKFGKGKDNKADKSERKDPTMGDAAKNTQPEVNPVLRDEKALISALADKLGTAPEYISNITLTHDHEDPSKGHALSVTIEPLEGVTENPSVNDISLTELLGHKPEDLDVNEFAQTVFRADQLSKANAKTNEPAPQDTPAVTPDQALQTVSNFPKEMAEELGAGEIPEDQMQAWKDLTGAGHLYLRGAAAPLIRMANGNPDATKAKSAMGTVGFAQTKPGAFPGDHVSDIAQLAAKALTAEAEGKPVSDALTQEELAYIAQEVAQFSNGIQAMATIDGMPEHIKAYVERVGIVNEQFQKLASNELKAALKPATPEIVEPADGKKEDQKADTAPEAPSLDNAALAVSIISDFPKEMAASLGIEITQDTNEAWRDFTGSGHLYVRGAWASLERMHNGQHNEAAANAAMGTLGFAAKAPDKFFGENVPEVAALASKILDVEKAGGTVKDAVTAEELAFLKTELQNFSDGVVEKVSAENAPIYVAPYAAVLKTANAHYQNLANTLKAEITGPTVEPKADAEPVVEADPVVKPKRETDIMKAANKALLAQKGIDIDDVLDADPNKVFAQIDALDLKAEGTNFKSVEDIKTALKDLKAHRVAVRAKHEFSSDNVAAAQKREEREAPFYDALGKLNGKIDAINADDVESISIPHNTDRKNHQIVVTYKTDSEAGPKRVTVPYAAATDVHGAHKALDIALMRLRGKFGNAHDDICHANQNFVREQAKNGGVPEEHKIDIDQADDLGVIHFGQILYKQIGPKNINKADLLGAKYDAEEGTLDFVHFDGSYDSVKVNVHNTIFKSGEDMAEAVNRMLENERMIAANARYNGPAADAA